MPKRTIPLIFVGGFLGAGKTTLLWKAAKRLIDRGLKVGLITNDQAPGLVDTEFLRRQGVSVGEVAGSCFCCNFDALIREASALRHAMHADVLIAEPVGSCTDLSATILQPLKEHFRDHFHVAPLSVLADPTRLAEVLSDVPAGLHPGAAYIYWKQLEEADVILVNKSDLLDPARRLALETLISRRLPGRSTAFISALEGEGVDSWLDMTLSGGEGGTRILDIDYDLYAAGEAALGWLNATYSLKRSKGSASWQGLARSIMECLAAAFARERANVGHVKLLLEAGDDHVAGNLTHSGAEPSFRGTVTETLDTALLNINARVEMPPERLRAIVEGVVASVAGAGIAVSPHEVSALSPGRPRPTHRYAKSVPQRGDKAQVRKWITAALLLFMAVYVVSMISKEFLVENIVAPQPGEIVSDGVVVFYFHGHFRCATCDRIERFTRECVARAFPAQAARNAVAYRAVNTDIPANAHFTERYRLATRTVVIVRMEGRVERHWKRLDRVWDLVGDEVAFKRYVRDEILAYLDN